MFKNNRNKSLSYIVYTPDNFDKQRRYPLVLFLHGSGERGDNLSELSRHGILKEIKNGRKLDCVVLAPQCPSSLTWVGVMQTLHKLLLNYIAKDYIDENRVYVTGLSMGGYGTWLIAEEYPELFAAVAPLCGGGVPWNTENMKRVPVLAYHGDCDKSVDISESRNCVSALNSFGGNASLTVYHGVSHDCWTRTYADDDFYSKLFSFVKQ